jgi:dynein intermediate chain 1
LDEEFTRILNANNPLAPQNISRYSSKERAYKNSPNVDHLIVHFEYQGYLIFKGTEKTGKYSTDDNDDGKKSDGDKNQNDPDVSHADGDGDDAAVNTEPSAEADEKKNPLRNQFNYSERASQTLNHAHRERSTNTEPPPQKNFNGYVSQWVIYDAYNEDLALKEKLLKEKTGKASTKKEEISIGTFVNSSAVVGTIESVHDDYKANTEVKKVSSILERMCNQNIFDEISQDYKYFDDSADDFRDGKGILLPLWKFVHEKENKKQITAVSWNPNRVDLFAISFGSYDFMKQGPGLIACFSFKNPSFPEFIFKTECGVLCLDFNKEVSHFLYLIVRDHRL